MAHARIEPLEPRLQLSGASTAAPAAAATTGLTVRVQPAAATGGELSGPSAVAFGDLSVGDSLDNEQTVTVTNNSSHSVQLSAPYSHDTSQVTIDLGGYPVGGFLDPGSSASFGVVANTAGDLTIKTLVTAQYNDGADQFLDIPVTATVGAGSTPDSTPPTAKISYARALRVNAKYYYFAVTYADDTAVNTSTLDANDILVSRRKYPTLHAVLISKSTTANARSVTAVYAVRYGPRGMWSSAFDGNWTISLANGQVADTSGNTTSAATLGQVAFLIPATATARPAARTAAAASSPFSATPLSHHDAVWDA
jgi:hypothetical protein